MRMPPLSSSPWPPSNEICKSKSKSLVFCEFFYSWMRFIFVCMEIIRNRSSVFFATIGLHSLCCVGSTCGLERSIILCSFWWLVWCIGCVRNVNVANHYRQHYLLQFFFLRGSSCFRFPMCDIVRGARELFKMFRLLSRSVSSFPDNRTRITSFLYHWAGERASGCVCMRGRLTFFSRSALYDSSNGAHE